MKNNKIKKIICGFVLLSSSSMLYGCDTITSSFERIEEAIFNKKKFAQDDKDLGPRRKPIYNPSSIYAPKVQNHNVMKGAGQLDGFSVPAESYAPGAVVSPSMDYSQPPVSRNLHPVKKAPSYTGSVGNSNAGSSFVPPANREFNVEDYDRLPAEPYFPPNSFPSDSGDSGSSLPFYEGGGGQNSDFAPYDLEGDRNSPFPQFQNRLIRKFEPMSEDFLIDEDGNIAKSDFKAESGEEKKNGRGRKDISMFPFKGYAPEGGLEQYAPKVEEGKFPNLGSIPQKPDALVKIGESKSDMESLLDELEDARSQLTEIYKKGVSSGSSEVKPLNMSVNKGEVNLDENKSIQDKPEKVSNVSELKDEKSGYIESEVVKTVVPEEVNANVKSPSSSDIKLVEMPKILPKKESNSNNRLIDGDELSFERDWVAENLLDSSSDSSAEVSIIEGEISVGGAGIDSEFVESSFAKGNNSLPVELINSAEPVDFVDLVDDEEGRVIQFEEVLGPQLPTLPVLTLPAEKASVGAYSYSPNRTKVLSRKVLPKSRYFEKRKNNN